MHSKPRFEWGLRKKVNHNKDPSFSRNKWNKFTFYTRYQEQFFYWRLPVTADYWKRMVLSVKNDSRMRGGPPRVFTGSLGRFIQVLFCPGNYRLDMLLCTFWRGKSIERRRFVPPRFLFLDEMFNIQCLIFKVEHSIFNVQHSMFAPPRLGTTFNIQRWTYVIPSMR